MYNIVPCGPNGLALPNCRGLVDSYAPNQRSDRELCDYCDEQWQRDVHFNKWNKL